MSIYEIVNVNLKKKFYFFISILIITIQIFNFFGELHFFKEKGSVKFEFSE